MTADLAAGDPFPRFHLGTHLASIPKDDEALVFQVPLHHSTKISTPVWHGTNHAIAASIGNFPSRPHDNRRHDTNHSLTTTSAPTSVSTRPYACNNHAHNTPYAPLVSDRPKFDLDTLRRQVQRNKEALKPLEQFLGLLPETTACKPHPDPSHQLPTWKQEALKQAVRLTLSPSQMDSNRPPTSMQPTTCSAATTPQPTNTVTPTAVQNLPTISPTTPTVTAPTTNPALTTTDLRTMTLQHHRQLTMSTTVPTTTPTSTTTMTDTQPPPTPPTIVIDFSAITTFLVRHQQHLDHLGQTIQRLSHTMAKITTIADDITRIIQQKTNAQLIAVEATSNPTFPSPTPSNAKLSYPQQSPATITLNSIPISRLPATPVDLTAIPNHPTNTFANNNTSAQWYSSPCPAAPDPPFLLKPMLARMRHKPQPSLRFMTMLS